MKEARKKGIEAEELAKKYIQTKGFELVESNYRHKRGEIDLIAMKDNLLLFIEVKYRSNLTFGNPENFVSEKQSRLIVETADEYIHAINWNGNIRFDIIAINAQQNIEHFEDAFY